MILAWILNSLVGLYGLLLLASSMSESKPLAIPVSLALLMLVALTLAALHRTGTKEVRVIAIAVNGLLVVGLVVSIVVIGRRSSVAMQLGYLGSFAAYGVANVIALACREKSIQGARVYVLLLGAVLFFYLLAFAITW